MVFMEVKMQGNVIVRLDQLNSGGADQLHKAITLNLLQDIARWRLSKEHGYYITVNTINTIGEGQVDDQTGEVIFPVSFTCTTMKPCKGEILIGTIDKVMSHGVFIKCGLIENIFLSSEKMKDYYNFFVAEKAMFVNRNDQHLRLEEGIKVRFKVLATKWIVQRDREFHVLATIEGDNLGPI